MPKVLFKARLRKWGNTYGITVSPKEVERLKAREGTEINVMASTEPVRVDYSDIAVGSDPDPDAGRKHDQYLAEYWFERKRGKKR